MKQILLGILVVCLFSLSGCNLKEKYTRTIEIPLAVNSGQKLTVHTEVGSIDVAESNNPQAGLKAVITGRGDTIEKAQQVAESINIKIENSGNAVCVEIDKPAEIKNNWFSVDYSITVPANINLECKTDVGSVNVSGIRGDIDASCDVGSVICEEAYGKLRIRTDVGNIKAAFAEDAGGKVNADLAVDVGGIDFKCPKNLSAELDAATDVGSISSELPCKIRKDCCSRKLNGTIGSGDGNIRLRTDVGSIKIRKN